MSLNSCWMCGGISMYFWCIFSSYFVVEAHSIKIPPTLCEIFNTSSKTHQKQILGRLFVCMLVCLFDLTSFFTLIRLYQSSQTLTYFLTWVGSGVQLNPSNTALCLLTVITKINNSYNVTLIFCIKS